MKTIPSALVTISLTLFTLLVPAVCLAADIRITDTSGAQVIVRNATIDYSAGLAAVRESDGIRVLQGEGTVTLKWKDVEAIKVVRRDDAARPARLDVDVMLRSGRHVTAALQRDGDTKLRGTTELGEYAIDLEKITELVPLR